MVTNMLFLNIRKDLNEAQLAKDAVKVSVLRLLLSEIKNAEIDKRGDLTEDDIISVIQKEAKIRREAAEGFRLGQREEQAQKEEAELKILESYLPAQLSNEQLTIIIEESIKEVGAKGIADMGKVMGVTMGKVKGEADGNSVSNIVREKLS